METTGMLIDVHKRNIYPAVVHFKNGVIINIEKSKKSPDYFILPGLIDAYIHTES